MSGVIFLKESPVFFPPSIPISSIMFDLSTVGSPADILTLSRSSANRDENPLGARSVAGINGRFFVRAAAAVAVAWATFGSAFVGA